MLKSQHFQKNKLYKMAVFNFQLFLLKQKLNY